MKLLGTICLAILLFGVIMVVTSPLAARPTALETLVRSHKVEKSIAHFALRKGSGFDPDLRTLTLLYEALDTKSRDFIVKQFAPTQQKLGAYLNFVLGPWGNTNFTLINGQMNVTCEHGPVECAANLVHGCSTIEPFDNPTQALQQILCIYESARFTTDPVQAAKDCLGQFDFNIFDQIGYYACVNDAWKSATEYILDIGITMANSGENITSFPWLAFGDDHIAGQNETDAFADLTKYLCDAVLRPQNVTECAEYY